MTVRRALILALAVASAVFIAVQSTDGWNRISDKPLPGAAAMVGAVALLGVGQVMIGEAMVAVGAGAGTAAQRRWAFHVTQPAKYVPLGVAHAVGAVTALASCGVSRLKAGVLWAIHTATLVVVGVALGLILSPSLGWPPAIALLGVCVPLLLNRRALASVFIRLSRFSPALGHPELIPDQRRINWCGAMAALGVLLYGVAYAVLVSAAGIEQPLIASVAAYCIALGVSIATPLPGGLGAREAMLLALSTAPAGEALVPVILVRLLLVAVEVAFWAVASARRPSGSPTSAATPA